MDSQGKPERNRPRLRYRRSHEGQSDRGHGGKIIVRMNYSGPGQRPGAYGKTHRHRQGKQLSLGPHEGLRQKVHHQRHQEEDRVMIIRRLPLIA